MKYEIWKPVVGYEGLYEVSSLGRVRSLNFNHTRQEKVLKVSKNKYGYLCANLCKNGKYKTCTVHRLVASAFIPNPLNLPEVNHINEDKTDNRVENLEWVSRIQNCNHGSRNQRMAKSLVNRPDLSKQVAQYTLDGTLVAEYPSTYEAARQTGFNRQNICACCCGKRKTCGGYIWKFV